jgi:syntaxin 1B/2/3
MTLAELANLFKDMEELIMADEEPLKQAEQDTQDAVGYIEQGDNELEKARRSAIRTRRLKWWTLIVVILIVLVIALALGLYFRFR